jgi:hypothetical protein
MHQNHCSTPARRIHLASAMLASEGKYGFVSQLSREQNISRQSLYLLKSRGQEAMERVFKSNQSPAEGEIQIERAVLTLFTEGHASREGIQTCLEELLGVHVSTGKISSILHEAGKRAQEWLDQQIPEGMRDLAIDEQYSHQRGEAYLNIVDAHTTFVYASCPPVAVDGESWALLLLQMKDHGLRWRVVVSDGGKAIGRAVREVTPDVIHQRDVWHVIHECQKVQRRMDRAVASLDKQTPAVERNAKRVEAGKKPLGRNPKTDVHTHAADLRQMEYVATSLRYLTCELQRLLEIVVLTDQGGILGSQARQEECDALLDLFAQLCEVTPPPLKKTMEKLLRHVQLALPNLLAFCPLLDGLQQTACEQLGEAAVHLIGWAWQRCAILGPTCEQLVVGFPPDWQPQASKVLAAWDQAVRSSSAVENWHSILRPFIAVHRHLSAHMLAILAVWHNHRVASRGRNLGQSPLTRTGLAKQSTDWLAALGYAHLPSPSPQPIPSSIVRSSPEMEIIAA